MDEGANGRGSYPFPGVSEKGSGLFFLEMSVTRAEFLRLLPVAVGHDPWRIDGDHVVDGGARPAWRIRLDEGPGRAFGPVRLPVLGVTIELGETAQADRAAFIDRFLLGFQRAGG